VTIEMLKKDDDTLRPCTESAGAGTCAIAAYNQTLLDELLGVDGDEEFSIYMAPVWKVVV